mgnify:FL=1
MEVVLPRQRYLLLLVAVLTLVWGTSWVLFPVAVREVSVWTFRSICLLGAGVLLLLVVRLRGQSLYVPPRERMTLVLAGLTYLAVWIVASLYAALLLPSGQASMLGFTMPIWASLLAWMFLKEKPTIRVVLSVLLAVVGVGCLAFAARDSFAAAPLGFVVGLSAGVGWAIGTTMLKLGRLTVTPLISTAWQLVIAGVPVAIVSILFGSRELFLPSWTSILAIGYVTVFSIALGNVVWFYILDMLSTTVSGIAIVMVPMVAMVTGALVRDEPLGILQVAAIVCCAVAMGLVLIGRSP